MVPKSPAYGKGNDTQLKRNDEQYRRGGLTRMRLGGSQFAHLKVASLIRSMYLRWALPFAQGNRRAR